MSLTNSIDKALNRFQATREGARRFHRDAVGDQDISKSFASWLAAVKDRDERTLSKFYDGGVVQKAAMNETSGTQGGYLVPQQMSDAMFVDISTKSLFRQHGALEVEMNGAQLLLPLPDVQTAQAAGTAPYFGGAKLNWSTDTSLTESAEMKFRDLSLRAHLLEGYAITSEPFIRDALNVDTWLRRTFADAAGYYVDYACFQGSGVGMPQGVINASGSATKSRAVANQIAVADVQGMIDNLLPSSWEKDTTCWFAHPSTLPQLSAITGWVPNFGMELYGKPVVMTGKCSTLGTRGDLVLADCGGYVVADRKPLLIDYSPHEPTAFLNFQSAWRVAYRGDGQLWTASPITLPDGSSQVSFFVVLV